MVAQRLLGGLLQVAIDGEHEGVARDVSATSLEHAQLAAERVDLDLLAAVDAAQLRPPKHFSRPALPIRSPSR